MLTRELISRAVQVGGCIMRLARVCPRNVKASICLFLSWVPGSYHRITLRSQKVSPPPGLSPPRGRGRKPSGLETCRFVLIYFAL